MIGHLRFALVFRGGHISLTSQLSLLSSLRRRDVSSFELALFVSDRNLGESNPMHCFGLTLQVLVPVVVRRVETQGSSVTGGVRRLSVFVVKPIAGTFVVAGVTLCAADTPWETALLIVARKHAAWLSLPPLNIEQWITPTCASWSVCSFAACVGSWMCSMTVSLSRHSARTQRP